MEFAFILVVLVVALVAIVFEVSNFGLVDSVDLLLLCFDVSAFPFSVFCVVAVFLATVVSDFGFAVFDSVVFFFVPVVLVLAVVAFDDALAVLGVFSFFVAFVIRLTYNRWQIEVGL